MKSDSTIIIGSGIVGVCTAYYLAKRGHHVTVISRQRIDEGVSTGNAGMIALGHPPLPRPGLTWKTIKWMFDPASPLYVPLRIDFELLKWMWRFRKACGRDHFQRSMTILSDLGWETQRLWDQLVDEEQLDCEYSRTGWLDVFRSEAGREHAMSDAGILREHGYNADELSGDELRDREPAFTTEVLGAVHYTDSRFANPRKCVVEIAKAAERHGALFIPDTNVNRIVLKHYRFASVETDDGVCYDADTLVLAAGIWTSELARTIGVDIPMQAGKGYHVMVTPPAQCPSIACVLNERYVAATPMSGQLRLAGTVELSGINHNLVQRRLDLLTESAREYINGIDECTIGSHWCGLRPCTADGLPVIGWAPQVDNVFIATGHAKYGFAYGPATGKLACDTVLDGEAPFDLSSISPARFAKM